VLDLVNFFATNQACLNRAAYRPRFIIKNICKRNFYIKKEQYYALQYHTVTLKALLIMSCGKKITCTIRYVFLSFSIR